MNDPDSANAALLHTPLHDWHVHQGARLVDFAGWHMPLQYTSIIAEHHAVRTAAGLFDVGHMGRLEIAGPDAAAFLDRLVTRRCGDMATGRIRYALLTNDRGGTIDDVLVYRLPDRFLVVCNAANRPRVLRWLDAHREQVSATLTDRTEATFMLALQGPRALEIARDVLGSAVAALRYYHGRSVVWDGQSVLVSRTGYTGEDGIEAIVDADAALALWSALWEAGRNRGLMPAGLGARDTLRLEAGMPLYGHELTEKIDPLTAGLEFAVDLDKDFVGRDALRTIAERGPQRTRVGLSLDSRRIARQGCAVFPADGNERIGEVTSGTFSPTLQRSIAMAYVPRSFAETGTRLRVDIRGRYETATVCPLPFYRRPRSSNG
ncbi:MAG: glycine cleavage system aminomethyltransferase GcvT [Planctomycetota bacterium]|nr:MAG: glycine cleavage system aminomethyltransferase GcvT [Planctomycetota bacterium]